MNKEDLVYKTCLLVVQHIKDLIAYEQTTGIRLGYHSRLFQHLLHPEEDFILLGYSKKLLQDEQALRHPEHIVPCSYMIWELERLIRERNYPDDELAQALQKNWKIAYITKDESYFLDGKEGLNLKSTMPEGWDFMTDNPEARLKLANIELDYHI